MANHFQAPITIIPKPNPTKGEQEAEEEASLLARRLSNAASLPMVLKAALELGVIDTMVTVGDSLWLSPSEIAQRLPTKPSNPEAPVLLDRMLRFLASYSVFKCRSIVAEENGQTGKVERVYAAEPVCNFLLNNRDVSGSFASLFMLDLSDVFIKTWTHLKDVILEGKDAFSSAHGMKLFKYIQTDEGFGKVFNRAMLESSTMVMEKVLRDYEGFTDAKTLVDVGGGLGSTLGLITSKYPHIIGINFDLAVVLANAPSYPGVTHVAGDMFTKIPNADAIFMKWILHDWTDEHCVQILKNCWKSLKENGKVIIVEMVTPVEAMSRDICSNIVFGMDITMLTQCSSGKERSLSEYETLAHASGFSRCEIVCPVSPFSVIEIYK
ncbi:PREDICTED: indole glucosinolate O-methyltransferase 1-like [Camelina sativa]|uniref:Indole glucosinolate O-methyltransferase 1-like n=1 Tax=Camelina sativa TaxID=90675 RepID=A0ABM0ULL1_CAMSA|nr:PREDICTED: indole glucosinolate O-methyltransferase 1-like [Camelina sativa]